MTFTPVTVENERETVELVVVTTTERKELRVPMSVVNDLDMLTAHLQEQGISLPESPVLTKGENQVVLHEAPQFG